MLQKIEAALYRRGFENPDTRQLVRNQVLLTLAACLAALAGGWVIPQLLDFAAGTLLATWNFCSLASFVQRTLARKRAAVAGLLLRFYARLLFTGLALYALLVWAGSSAVALIAGLSTVVVTLFIWGASRMARKHV
ncbi:ATP synthase subunit I [Desulfocurvus sp. DL9XJH121]